MAAQSKASRFGSINAHSQVMGSEHHRRTSSMKKTTEASYNTPSSNRNGVVAYSNSASDSTRFASWKFPSPTSTDCSPSTSACSSSSTPMTSPETLSHKAELLPSATVNMLNRIDENASDDSDDTYSSDGSPSRLKHRSSPSLPYGPLATPYSSYHSGSKHRNGGFLMRSDRASLLRFLNSNLRRLRPVDVGYGLIFLSCFAVFMSALTGIGYSTPPRELLPLPDIQLVPEQIPPPRVPDLNLNLPVVPPLPRAIRQIEVQPADNALPVKRVEPLRAQQPVGEAKPLIITDDSDHVEEDLPAWARFKTPKPAVKPHVSVAHARQAGNDEISALQNVRTAENELPYEVSNIEDSQIEEDDETVSLTSDEGEEKLGDVVYIDSIPDSEIESDSDVSYPEEVPDDEPEEALAQHHDQHKIFVKAPPQPESHHAHGQVPEDELYQDEEMSSLDTPADVDDSVLSDDHLASGSYSIDFVDGEYVVTPADEVEADAIAQEQDAADESSWTSDEMAQIEEVASQEEVNFIDEDLMPFRRRKRAIALR